MYRRPLAGVFEFGFCANGENEKQSQKRRPEASGTNSESEKNDVVLCAKHPRSSAPSSLGHRRHFQDRLPAGPVLLKGDTKMKKDTANGRALFYSRSYWLRRAPSKCPVCMQHFLKPATRTARAEIVSAEFFDELLVAMNDAEAALHFRF